MGLYSIFVVAGPKRDLDAIKIEKETYDVIHKFEVPSDHGEFPDTTGYERDNFDEISSVMEDSQLWPYMQKCMDAVVDYTLKKADMLERRNFININTDIAWPKEGGSCFYVAGFVNYEPAPHPMGKQIVIN